MDTPHDGPQVDAFVDLSNDFVACSTRPPSASPGTCTAAPACTSAACTSSQPPAAVCATVVSSRLSMTRIPQLDRV
jgi:hypothetical protein